MSTAPPAPFQGGDRIRLLNMPFDPAPIPAGSEGTVVSCSYVPMTLKQGNSEWQVIVRWDSGRSLSLCIPPDSAIKI